MGRQLGQLRPANTTAASLFSPDENKPYKINVIIIVNTSGSAASATIYHDIDGSTYDETTTILPAKSITASGFYMFQPNEGIGDYNKAGNVGVKSSVADALTFTAYGEILGETL